MNLVRRSTLVTLFCLGLASALVPHAAQAATVQGSGTAANETRSVAEFQAISTSGSMDLVVRQGPQQVQVQADDNLVPMIETYVETGNQGPTLFVRWKRSSSYWTRAKVLVTVSLPKLSALSTSGSGDIKLEAFSTPALKVSLSGSGDARLNGLTTDDLGIRIAGSGDVSGNGKASKLSISIAGSGDVRLAEMRADDVQVQIAGSGDAAINAEKTLSVSIAGSGDVSYSGNATVKSSVAGSGSVNKR
jgi:carbon monoxide dehydrogenase subunit G